ncbi:8872_t:CDS:1 [Scutellospora calospora]|uniref:8872_t:CDS:1 n=1 Tax=Scutellospora calospora TaxID=85575 RepID=A0ACA9JXJ9_9GLOM|nr:8872_t:CDS:1 [Scutellospora calospora]
MFFKVLTCTPSSSKLRDCVGKHYRGNDRDRNKNNYDASDRDRNHYRGNSGYNSTNRDKKNNRNAKNRKSNNNAKFKFIPPKTTSISSNIAMLSIPTSLSRSLTTTQSIPTSSSRSDILSTPTFTNHNSAADTAGSDNVANPFSPDSPFRVIIIIGIIIVVLIALIASYFLLRKAFFVKKRYDSNKRHLLDRSTAGTDLGISWANSLNNDAEIRPPTTAITSNRSSMAQFDQLINIDLSEDNSSNYFVNISGVQDFLEPARRSSAFLDGFDYVEPEVPFENIENEVIQQPAAAFLN